MWLLDSRRKGHLDHVRCAVVSRRDARPSENSLHYHLNRLAEAELVENRKRERPNDDGLYSYYERTGLGADLIDAATEFIGQEKAALDQY